MDAVVRLQDLDETLEVSSNDISVLNHVFDVEHTGQGGASRAPLLHPLPHLRQDGLERDAVLLEHPHEPLTQLAFLRLSQLLAGEDHDREAVSSQAHSLQHLEPIGLRHDQIEHHQRGRIVTHLEQGVSAIRCAMHGESVCGEPALHQKAGVLVVIDDQHVPVFVVREGLGDDLGERVGLDRLHQVLVGAERVPAGSLLLDGEDDHRNASERGVALQLR